MKITDVEAIVVKQPTEIEMVGDGSQNAVAILVHTENGSRCLSLQTPSAEGWYSLFV